MARNTDAAARLLRVNGIVEESIVDGPGLRMSVFAQGCPHVCPGCHNPDTHAFEGGQEMDVGDIFASFQENPLLSGITFSGGEPFCQPAPFAALGRMVRATGKNVWAYTGYVYEDLLAMAQRNPDIQALLDVTDVLVDGPYIEAQRNLEMPFRGSENQRIIQLHGKQ